MNHLNDNRHDKLHLLIFYAYNKRISSVFSSRKIYNSFFKLFIFLFLIYHDLPLTYVIYITSSNLWNLICGNIFHYLTCFVHLHLYFHYHIYTLHLGLSLLSVLINFLSFLFLIEGQ